MTQLAGRVGTPREVELAVDKVRKADSLVDAHDHAVLCLRKAFVAVQVEGQQAIRIVVEGSRERKPLRENFGQGHVLPVLEKVSAHGHACFAVDLSLHGNIDVDDVGKERNDLVRLLLKEQKDAVLVVVQHGQKVCVHAVAAEVDDVKAEPNAVDVDAERELFGRADLEELGRSSYRRDLFLLRKQSVLQKLVADRVDRAPAQPRQPSNILHGDRLLLANGLQDRKSVVLFDVECQNILLNLVACGNMIWDNSNKLISFCQMLTHI